MVVPLLGYFFCMIAVLTAVAGVMIGLSNTSTSERVRHYPRSVVERNIAATKSEPRLFMAVPTAKDGSPAKNLEANAEVRTEKTDAKKSKPQKSLAHHNFERPGYRNAMGYAAESRNGPQRLFANW